MISPPGPGVPRMHRNVGLAEGRECVETCCGCVCDMPLAPKGNDFFYNDYEKIIIIMISYHDHDRSIVSI